MAPKSDPPKKPINWTIKPIDRTYKPKWPGWSPAGNRGQFSELETRDVVIVTLLLKERITERWPIE